MTPQEIQSRLQALRNEMGPKSNASISVSIYPYGSGGSTVGGYVTPTGNHSDGFISVSAATFEDALGKLEAGWAEYRDRHFAQKIRKMALAIIEITADQDDCSDAALRQAGFLDADIADHGKRACVEADRIANNGPFSIVSAAKSNGAPLEHSHAA